MFVCATHTRRRNSWIELDSSDVIFLPALPFVVSVQPLQPDVVIPKGVDEVLRHGTGKKPEDDATLLRRISQIIT